MNYLIVGLGNIGDEYKYTRHNIGFMVLDKLAQTKGLIFSNEKLGAKASLKYRGSTIHLIKPNTFMNCSGKCVSYWQNKFMLTVDNMLIIVDDIALPLGTLRIKSQGSHAGHNGLLDIGNVLKTMKYPRLRIGIGNDFLKGEQAEYVLGRFKTDEIGILDMMVNLASDAILSFCSDGIVSAMNKYN
jgi:PTH1 family peptidyl-tRNA hydrolase